VGTRAAGADQQQILALGDEVAPGELEDTCLGKGGDTGEIELLQPLLEGGAGLGEAALALAIGTFGDFLLEQGLQVGEGATAPRPGVPGEGDALPGHRRQVRLLAVGAHQRRLEVIPIGGGERSLAHQCASCPAGAARSSSRSYTARSGAGRRCW
jgi:hypothetical protein